MKDILFDTEAKRKAAISKFANLKNDPGWLLLVSILEANIEVIRTQLEDGIDGETKEQIDRRRDLLKAYRNLISTPDKIIDQLQGSSDTSPNPDPFLTLPELKKMRHEAA